MAIGLLLVLAGLVAGSQFVTNPEDLGKRFARAQKLLATGDFAGAQRMYEGVLAVSGWGATACLACARGGG